ncbi:MAG: ABC transporter substrate-binding protein [Burkholderiales bacterium]|nr:ABC transporter substrate-binding protein [Burkholderiales bacterium]
MITRRHFLWGTAAVAALAAGCAGTGKSPNRTLVIGTATKPNSFDPQYQYFGPNRQAHMPVFEPLVMYGPGLELNPALASAWRAVDATTWEITLRPNVVFHDGSPFIAEDVVFSLDRAGKVPNSPSSLGVFVRAIDKIEIVNPTTLRIRTKAAVPLLMNDLANVPIISKKISSGATTASFNAGIGVIGTGPYRFLKWDGDLIQYQAFEGHWGGRQPWSHVNVIALAQAEARVQSLLSGQCQLIDQVPPESVARLRSTATVRLFDTPSNFLMFLHMDQARQVTPFVTDKQGKSIPNPLRDVRVRKALSLAINRAALSKEVLGNSAVPANQLLPPSFPGTIQGLQGIPYDPRAARQLLAAAGYADGFRLVMHGTDGRYASDKQVLGAIALGLREIGIDAQSVSLPSNEFFARASAGSGKNGEPEFSVIQVGWASVEPSGVLKGLLATPNKSTGFGASNRGMYSNRKVDDTLARALQTVDNHAREDLIREATRQAVVEDQGIIPLYYPTSTWAALQDVRYLPRVDSATYPMDAMAA